jgi:hypothetical protein
MLRSDIHKLINSIWNKEELPEQWKVSVIVPVYKKDDETDCNNCRGVLLLFSYFFFIPNPVFCLLLYITPKTSVFVLVV